MFFDSRLGHQPILWEEWQQKESIQLNPLKSLSLWAFDFPLAGLNLFNTMNPNSLKALRVDLCSNLDKMFVSWAISNQFLQLKELKINGLGCSCQVDLYDRSPGWGLELFLDHCPCLEQLELHHAGISKTSLHSCLMRSRENIKSLDLHDPGKKLIRDAWTVHTLPPWKDTPLDTLDFIRINCINLARLSIDISLTDLSHVCLPNHFPFKSRITHEADILLTLIFTQTGIDTMVSDIKASTNTFPNSLST